MWNRVDKFYAYVLQYQDWFARGALSLIFVWFGGLKLIGLSPAVDLIVPLFNKIAPFLDNATPVFLLGAVELVIGVFILVPRCTRWVVSLMVLHLLGTFLTLLLLPELAWSAFLVPTLIGEFVFKNVALITLGFSVLKGYYHKH